VFICEHLVDLDEDLQVTEPDIEAQTQKTDEAGNTDPESDGAGQPTFMFEIINARRGIYSR
jgi:hypothetical protein